MSCSSEQFGVLNYAIGFTHWVYQTEDNLEEVTQNGYFNDVSQFVRTGDFVDVNTPKESAILVLSVVGTDKVNSVVMCQTVRENNDEQ